MKTSDSFHETDNRLSQPRNAQIIRIIQVFSWALTLFFLVSLIGAIYQAVINRNPLPAWAWIGLVTLFAVATGLAVAAVVYRGVTKQVGPFDYRTSTRVAGEIRSEVKYVEAGGARSLRAEIHMTAGVLRLAGGASDAFEAAFTYDDADWKRPEVEYRVDPTSKGELSVEQKAAGRPAMRPGRCEWAIRLNEDLPTELFVKFGAGNADLELGGLALERLRVESGVGELELDLSGAWKHNLEAFIKAGIGDTTLRLPRDVGVRLRSTVGLGSIQHHGLTRDGENFTNALYGQSPVTLDITIEGGIGKIHVQEDG
jgi:hypothetical protein